MSKNIYVTRRHVQRAPKGRELIAQLNRTSPSATVANYYTKTDTDALLILKAPLASPTFTGDVTLPGTGIWNSSGNVGIGTLTPARSLEIIKADTTNETLSIRNSSYTSADASGAVSIRMGFSNHVTKVIALEKTAVNIGKLALYGEYGFNTASLGLSLTPVGANNCTAYFTGKVGIGVSSPLKQCTLYGSEAAITPRLLLQSASATNPSGSTIDWWCSTDADYGSNPTARISGYRVASGAVGELKLGVRGASATLNDGMILTSYWGGSARSTVRVGINNMSPTEELDITGNVQYSGYLKGDELRSKTTGFVSGFAGTGYTLIKSGSDYNLEVDSLIVRKAMTVYDLIVRRQKVIGGSFIVSEGHKLDTVTENSDGSYTCTIDTDDGNLTVEFEVGDILRCQNFNGRNVKYYSAEVTDVNSAMTEFTMVVYDSSVNPMVGTPESGDEVARIGNVESASDRQGFIRLTSSDDDAPYIDVLDGVDSDDLSDKVKVRLGKLDGITDADLGSLSGYGLYSDRVYLKGKIVAESGKVGGWNIDTDAIYTGTKKTSAGFTSAGITIDANGALRGTDWEITHSGGLQISSIQIDDTFINLGTTLLSKGLRLAVKRITADKTLSGADCVIITTGSSDIDIDLPASPLDGDFFIIKRSGSGGVTVDGNGTNIRRKTDVVASFTISNFESYILIYDSAEWAQIANLV